MYVAKTTHTRVTRYDGRLEEHNPRKLALMAELRRAVSEDELVMYYQPTVDLLSGDVLGVEARLSAGGSRTRSATCDHRG